jgi:hypothetical protein
MQRQLRDFRDFEEVTEEFNNITEELEALRKKVD